MSKVGPGFGRLKNKTDTNSSNLEHLECVIQDLHSIKIRLTEHISK